MAQSNHKDCLKREEGGSESERKDLRTEAAVRKERCYTAGFEYGGQSHKPKNAGSLWIPEKTRKWVFPWSLQKEGRSSNTLTLAQ